MPTSLLEILRTLNDINPMEIKERGRKSDIFIRRIYKWIGITVTFIMIIGICYWLFRTNISNLEMIIGFVFFLLVIFLGVVASVIFLGATLWDVYNQKEVGYQDMVTEMSFDLNNIGRLLCFENSDLEQVKTWLEKKAIRINGRMFHLVGCFTLSITLITLLISIPDLSYLKSVSETDIFSWLDWVRAQQWIWSLAAPALLAALAGGTAGLIRGGRKVSRARYRHDMLELAIKHQHTQANQIGLSLHEVSPS